MDEFTISTLSFPSPLFLRLSLSLSLSLPFAALRCPNFAKCSGSMTPFGKFGAMEPLFAVSVSGKFVDIYLHEETASRSKSLQPIIKQNLLRLIFSWIYLTQSGNNRSQQISTTDSWAKFAVIDLFADMSDSVRKQPVAASFANRFLGEICCDWLVGGYI